MDINKVLTRVDEVYKDYSDRSSIRELPVNVETLLSLASEHAGLPIAFSSKSWTGGQIKGRILRYEDRALIEYSQELNTCWERFVITKELCHLLIDEPADYTDDIENLVDCLISCNLTRNGKPSAAEVSEHMCTIAALELLVPIKIRRDFYDSLKRNEITLIQVAHAFRIPAHYIELLFSDAYRKHIDEIHYQVIDAAEAKAADDARANDDMSTAALHNSKKS